MLWCVGSTLIMGCMAIQVLRFYAVWDDRKMLSGDRRPYVVHYYLEDDTMEVLETLHDQNSGRDHFPKFLRRARLLKVSFDRTIALRLNPVAFL